MTSIYVKALTLMLAATTACAVDFADDVLPIFKAHCYKCHDAKEQKGGLRLDLRTAALRGGSDGPVIIPGKSANSVLIHNVMAAKGSDDRMPPKGDRLSAAQIATLKRWIDAGARWPDEHAGRDERLEHWAWQAVGSRTSNMQHSTSNAERGASKNPIDSFIDAKLGEKGLRRSPKAGRRTLIRRLSFTLHGLPPSPVDVAAFVADKDPKAYEKLVDLMLASPHYGERFAQHWLDIAHYADTHGFERDRRRPNAWPYRDYVIDAFNNDKPYHRFLQEQIAGDVLWPDEQQAVIATGFLAAGPWDYVGQVETKSGVLRRSARSLDLDDMATQVMTSTMAVTINCARCHDHKLDPISQQEYYKLRAVFAGVKRADRPISQAAAAKLTAERFELVKQVQELEPGFDLADIIGGGDGSGSGTYRKGIDPRTGKAGTKLLNFLDNIKPNTFAAFHRRQGSGGQAAASFVDGVFIPKGDKGEAKIPISSTGLTITGIKEGDGKAWDIIRNGPVNRTHSDAFGGAKFNKDGNSVLGLHANAGITFDLAAFRKVAKAGALRFTAQVGYFGKEEDKYSADARVFVDGEKVAEFAKLKRADGLQSVDVKLPATARFLTLMSTDARNAISMDQIGWGLPVISAAADLSDADKESLTKLRARIADLDKAIAKLQSGKIYAVVPEANLPEVKLLRRGESESPVGEPLSPGALSAVAMLKPSLGTLDTPEGERRATLAKWITDPRNPLTNRVIANRLWHWSFGQGLVTTPSDFGAGGDTPSHPQLLDWMATELARQNGSLKSMLRLILNSETFKQDSRFAADSAGAKADAGNRLLWRQNARRIEAEAVRDAVLAVSGKLNLERGGPGFEDFKYEGTYAQIYRYITADEPKLWRRSIYRYIARTTPSRFLTTLDCPDPANMTPKRLTTTTPLQSLAMYNNGFMLKQAGYLAERLERDVPPASARQALLVKQAFALAFSRQPTKTEMELSTDFIEKHGLFAFCRNLLNANEFVYVD